jgi:hypothetical protein
MFFPLSFLLGDQDTLDFLVEQGILVYASCARSSVVGARDRPIDRVRREPSSAFR